MGLCGNDPPDPAKGYAAGINADLNTLPMRRLIEAASLLGDRISVDMPGGRRGAMTEFDFTGLGEADFQRQYADQLTREMLQLQRDLGPQFVAQRLRELEASDPAGASIRRQLWDSISQSSETLTNRPGAEQLQALIMGELEKGGQLDPETEERIGQGVRGGQVARGNFLGNAAVAEEAGTIASASEAQKSQRQQQALAFLTGGMAPEDANYREQQQDLSNLGAFLSGETPTAQFGQLSGAQNGVVPWTSSGPLQGVNANAGWQGVNNQAQLWGAQQQHQQNQVNPWIAGLSGAMQGGSAWASLGGNVRGTTVNGAFANVRSNY